MDTEPITVRLHPDVVDELDQEADERGLSRSEYLRRVVDERDRVVELEEERNRLQDRLASREERVEQLEEQLRRRSRVEDRVEEVALQLREDRESRQAPFPVRWWRWWRDRK